MSTTDDPDLLHAELTAPLDDEVFYAADPFDHYARLRREAPVAWNERAGYWAVAKHADVLDASRDPSTFCSGRGILTFEIGVEYPSPPTMMHTDPPEHTRYRKLVQPAFAPSRVRALEPAVRRRAASLLDRLDVGEPCDFVETVAIEYPLMIISDLLGIPNADWPRFYEWSEASIPQNDGRTEQERAALREEMQGYLLEITRERRDDPRDDLVSVLATVEVDGERLSEAELVMFLNQLLVAGNETTRNMVSGGVWALAERPDEMRRLVDDRSLVPTAVEEWLRWTTPVISFMRTATRDTQLRGVPIGAGEPVLLLYASANRDEDVFGPTADRFDVGRDPNHHVAFGFGAHFCLGAGLARLEGRVLLEELLARFDLLEPAGEVRRAASSVIAGVQHAPVILGRR